MAELAGPAPAAPQTRGGRRTGRVSGLTYGGAVLAILVVLLPALRPPQPPPPPTAEYAPPVQALKEPPPEQTSQSGHGAQGTGGGGSGTAPSPSAAVAGPTPSPSPSQVIYTPAIKHCIGDPPRQIEDTQSPPCVAYFQGDNGGATYQGVTATEIRVAFFDDNWGNMSDLPKFFNDHFEFYGRRLVLTNEGGCGGSPQSMQSNARRVAAKGYFASLGCGDAGGFEYYYYDELAKQRPPVLSVSYRVDVRSEAHMAQYAPYEWTYAPTLDRIEDHLAALACRQLAGKPAAYAPPQPLGPPNRTFGLVTTVYTNAPSPDTTELDNQLAACGIRIPSQDRKQMNYAGTVDQTVAQQGAAAALQFQQDHITTVICVCHSTDTQGLFVAAEGQGYQPEWLISSFLYQDNQPNGSASPSDQWSHAFGVSFFNKYVPIPDLPCYTAEHEANPSFNPNQSAFWYYGCAYTYPGLLLLASGIQMAGPILTPQTFEQGLFKTRFPNPPSPYYEGGVGFNHDHSFVKDAGLIWYDPTTHGPNPESQGTWCYVNHGARFGLDTYAQVAAAFFSRPCDP